MVDYDITKSQCESNNHTHGSLPPAIALPPDVALFHKRKMPKRKSKFGKGATRGGNRKSGRSETVDQHAEPAAAAGDAVSSDSAVVVKCLNKKQLQQRLDRNTKKLKCAEKKMMANRKFKMSWLVVNGI